MSLSFCTHLSTSLTIGQETIQPSTVVRDLGVWIDCELTLQKHISQVAHSCFCMWRRLCHIHNSYICQTVLEELTHSFVISRLDYCNCVMANYLVTELRVQNAAACLVLGLLLSDHVTPGLKKLHWLPIQQRITGSSSRIKICYDELCIC